MSSHNVMCFYDLYTFKMAEHSFQELMPRVWMGGGGYKCQLSVKILAICQLSVNWLLIINRVTKSFISVQKAS